MLIFVPRLLHCCPDSDAQVPAAAVHMPRRFCVVSRSLLGLRTDAAEQVIWQCCASVLLVLLSSPHVVPHLPSRFCAGALKLLRWNPDITAHVTRRCCTGSLMLLPRCPDATAEVP
jgi:hypothetical protein